MTVRLRLKGLPMPPWVQIVLHFAFISWYNLQSQALIPHDPIWQVATSLIGSAQTVLIIYGIYTPPPARQKAEAE